MGTLLIVAGRDRGSYFPLTEDATVICASSDYEQLALICDRVLIFAGGEVVASLVGNEITKDRILEQCFRTAVGARDDG